MRINIIPVEFLTDVHLRAEFREIIMSIHYYKRSVNSPKGIDRKKIPSEYTLNSGHAMFFYNKFLFIKNRYFQLLEEMKNRGFGTESIEELFLPLFEGIIPSFEINDYEVTKKDILVNIQRILEKIHYMEFTKGKPTYYKLNKVSMSFDDWVYYYHFQLDFDEILEIAESIRG